MPLAPGTTLGPYEILSPIGAGGMGEVYKARDTRLDRTVAIKVLPEHVAADPDLKQRFEREAKTISSLNHPHVCTLHDVGEHCKGVRRPTRPTSCALTPAQPRAGRESCVAGSRAQRPWSGTPGLGSVRAPRAVTHWSAWPVSNSTRVSGRDATSRSPRTNPPMLGLTTSVRSRSIGPLWYAATARASWLLRASISSPRRRARVGAGVGPVTRPRRSESSRRVVCLSCSSSSLTAALVRPGGHGYGSAAWPGSTPTAILGKYRAEPTMSIGSGTVYGDQATALPRQ